MTTTPLAPPPPAVPAPARVPAATGRLAWLDALRGIGALVVAFQHAGYRYVPELQWELHRWFDPGTFGITVFFLVSGYIVPASLTRAGSVRRFWISRLFRIYPLFLFASGVIVVLALTGLVPWRVGLSDYPAPTAVLAHLTMLQDLLYVPSMINVLWTLSYEMAFYLLVVALFTVRMHTRPAGVAAGFAVAALALGGLLPTAVLSRAAGIDLVSVAAAAALVAAICCAMSGRPAVRTAGALGGGALAFALITVNGRVWAWQGLAILAVMFTGTAIYQAERRHAERRLAGGRLAGRRLAGGVAALVLGCCVVAGVLHSRSWRLHPAELLYFQRGWTAALVLAALVFAAGLALRGARLPRWLTGLGVISYSVYLLHPVLFLILDQIIGRSRHDNYVMLAGAMAVLLPLCWLSHRLVEAPAQRAGRALARRFTTGIDNAD
jgi:peptidoglycan/LPS O-acetylase OafA/YrhL